MFKKIILSAAILLCVFASIAQPVIVNRSGPANTVQDARAAALYNSILPRYADTTEANLPYNLGLDSCGALIYTRYDNGVWQRQCSPKMWLRINGSGGCGLLFGGIVTLNGGLTFDVNRTGYCIGYRTFVYAGGNITLNAAHPSLPRFDVLALDTLGHLVKITGTPAASPAIPTIDQASQFYLTAVSVPAGATSPGGGVSAVQIYDENIGAPEWTGSYQADPGFTVNFASTTEAQQGVKSTFSTTTAAGAFGITYTSTSGPATANNYNAIKLYIKLTRVQRLNQEFIGIGVIEGNLPKAPTLDLRNYGFDISSTAWQNVTIPLSAFAWYNTNTTNNFDKIYFKSALRAGSGFSLDNITLQGGIQQPSTGGNYVTHVWKKPTTDSVFYDKGGASYFAFRDATGGTSSGIDSGAYRNYTQLNDTTFLLLRANGITDTFRFSIAGGGSGGTTYSALNPVVITGNIISLDTTNIANKGEIFFKEALLSSNIPGRKIVTKSLLDTVGIAMSTGQLLSTTFNVGGGGKFYGSLSAVGITSTNSQGLGLDGSSSQIYFSNAPVTITGALEGIKIGTSASTGPGGTSVGAYANTNGNNVAMGRSSVATANRAVSIGESARVTGFTSQGQGLALGASSSVRFRGGIALNGGMTEAAGQFVAGNVFYEAGSDNDPITEVYFGSGVKRGWDYYGSIGYYAGAGVSYSINGSGASGTNFAGGNVTLAGGKGTGTGTPGNLVFQTAVPGSSGTTLQSLTDRLTITPDGVYITNTSAPATPASGGVIWVEAGALKYKSAAGTVTTLAIN